MSQSAEQMLAQMSAALNLIAADQAALRVTLQCLILNVFGGKRESAQTLLDNMERLVVESLGRMPTNEKNLDIARATRDLHVRRAELLFKELKQAMGNSGSQSDPEPPG